MLDVGRFNDMKGWPENQFVVTRTKPKVEQLVKSTRRSIGRLQYVLSRQQAMRRKGKKVRPLTQELLKSI